MRVWIAECGCYESFSIGGVYASAELAMAAHPIPTDYKYPDAPSAFNNSRPLGWTCDEHGNWKNNLDWDAAVMISPYEVIE